jgi:DNA-binding NtrC family response regulator
MSFDKTIELATDELLHAAAVESLENKIMEVALERTGAIHGAIFLWDKHEQGLSVDFHVVEGVTINLPSTCLHPRHDGRPNGVALWVYLNNKPYLCNDTATDPLYAHYFLEVASIAAVPIPYQHRSIGVISVSSRHKDAFTLEHLEALEAVAHSAAKFLRRAQLFRAANRESGRFLLIKGLSPEWLEVERQLEQASPTEAPVLIHGESGTGKELVANAIHFNSKRSSKPFTVVNCAAIPDQLLESTLFGHVRGAFTGASFNKIGEFAKAHGGTLFLDEVGDLPLALQPKVLRAIEQGEVQTLGSNDPPRRVDVRLICATSRDLATMVRRGEYREDLYYRISLITMELPPLRSYRHNLGILAQVMLQQAARRHNKRVHRIAPDAMALFEAHSFPGNVRELKNVIEHAVIMTEANVLSADDLPLPMRQGPAPDADADADEQAAAPQEMTLPELREQWLAPLETQYLTELLERCDGNVRLASKHAGINIVTMYRLLKKRGLRLIRQVKGAASSSSS